MVHGAREGAAGIRADLGITKESWALELFVFIPSLWVCMLLVPFSLLTRGLLCYR